MKSKKELTTEEKSRFIFEKLEMGDCWHEIFDNKQKKCWVCPKCHYEFDRLNSDVPNPNYFESDKQCREMLNTIVKKDLVERFLDNLKAITHYDSNRSTFNLVASTTTQKAQSVFEVLKSMEGENDG